MRPSISIDGKKYYILDKLSLFQAGKGRRYEINGVDIAAFRFGDAVVAFGNRCPHEGGNLCDGFFQARHITCARHGWKFDVQTGKRDMDPTESIPVFLTKVQDGTVWINLEQTPSAA